jgi:enolase
MIHLDGPHDKKNLGANAILGVNMACVRAGAVEMVYFSLISARDDFLLT